MEIQETKNIQNNLENEKQSLGIHILGLKPYYKATVIKTVWSCHKDRHKHE